MPKHRLKIHNGYLCLCDPNGKIIEWQTSCKVESSVDMDAILKVTITCFVDVDDIHPDVFKERTYSVIEDKSNES